MMSASQLETKGETSGRDYVSTEYDDDLVPLQWIIDHWMIMASHIKRQDWGTDSNCGPGPFYGIYIFFLALFVFSFLIDFFLIALDTALKALKELYYLNHDGWIAQRDKVYVGLIKDTIEYGNTSVSMGAAKIQGSKKIGFLNCGTGGIKYQMYGISDDGILKLLKEVKPKNGCGLSDLEMDGYPKTKNSISFSKAQELLTKELNDAPWCDDRNVLVYAFVTGSIRQYWENADAGTKLKMEACIQKLFQPFGIQKPGTFSYFLDQATEGIFEYLGIQSMYGNLKHAKKLSLGTTLVASLGIGQGSCQWVTKKVIESQEECDWSNYDVLGYGWGMKNPTELQGFGMYLKNQFRGKSFRRFMSNVQSYQKPVIALKSGCLLVFQIYKHLKAQFMTPVKPLSAKRRYFISQGGNKKYAFVWTKAGSIARILCEIEYSMLFKQCEGLYDKNSIEITEIEAETSPQNPTTTDLGPVVTFRIPDRQVISAPPELVTTSAAVKTPAVGTQVHVEKRPLPQVPEETDLETKDDTLTPYYYRKTNSMFTHNSVLQTESGPINKLIRLIRFFEQVTGKTKNAKIVKPSDSSLRENIHSDTRSLKHAIDFQIRQKGSDNPISNKGIVDVSKNMEFWIFSGPLTDGVVINYNIEITILPYESDEQGPTFFKCLIPGEIRFHGPQKESTMKNTFKISFTPQSQGERNALVRVKICNSALWQNYQETNLEFVVYGKCSWMEKMSNNQNACDKQYTHFPLRYIPDKWQLMVRKMITPPQGICIGDNVESINGLHACLCALKDIYYMPTAVERWTKIKDLVEVGLLKDTRDCGNTSVSMGLAVTYLQRYPKKNFAAFLNCGTGGVKYQLYYRIQSGKSWCTTVAEAKPGNGAVSHICPIGDYRPTGFLKRQSLQEVRDEIVLGLKHAPWVHIPEDSDLPDCSELHGTLEEPFLPFAFVTGSIRNHWSNCTPEQKVPLDDDLSNNLFRGLCIPIGSLLQEQTPLTTSQHPTIKQESFFLSQDQEGHMEAIGVRAMYKTAYRNSPNAANTRRPDPVIIIGLGSGSCQVTIIRKKKSNPSRKKTEVNVIGYEHGMRSTQILRGFGQYIINSPFAIEIVAAVEYALENDRIPMIALKSGGLVRLWQKENGLEERKQLCTEPTTLQSISILPEGSVFHTTLPEFYSLARRCADAQEKSGAKQDFVRVFLNGWEFRQPKNEVLELKPDDVVQYSYLPEFLWWWPGQYMEKNNKSVLNSMLMIHVPFDLIKFFWERRGETIVSRFKQLLVDFFGYDSPKDPKSYECVAKVYRLLYDVYQDSHVEKLKIDFYTTAARFASQPPEYNEDLKVGMKDLPLMLPKISVLKRNRSNMCCEVLQQDEKRMESHRDWPEVLQKPLCCLLQANSEHLLRKAILLSEPFSRGLKSICTSNLLKEFQGLTSKDCVKSSESILRKCSQENAKPDQILDYLRGTIYVGRSKSNAPFLTQVCGILDCIEEGMGTILRIKLDACAKGFFIVNVLFKQTIENYNLNQEEIELVSEIQVRLPARETTVAPPDDHIKYEVERTFGKCVASSVMRLDTACLDFFTVPCGFEFQPFDEKQCVTMKMDHDVIFVEQKTMTNEELLKRDLERQSKDLVAQWSQELDRFPIFLRQTQDLDEAADEAVQQVWPPDYITLATKTNFTKGVKAGCKIIWNAIQQRDMFHNLMTNNSPFPDENNVVLYLACELRKLADEHKMGWTILFDIPAKFTIKTLADEIIKIRNPYLQGIMAACRFCRKNRLGYMLKHGCFVNDVIPKVVADDIQVFFFMRFFLFFFFCF
jgi:hypothetical protein